MANLNEVKKYHFIYKTTNLLNGKFYIGMHSTSNLKDGYLGSGKHLRYSIRKYGIQNFKIEILEWYDTRVELVAREKSLVNEDLLKDPMCMNLKPGGNGGFNSYAHLMKCSKAGAIAYINRLNMDSEFRKLRSNISSKTLTQSWKDKKLYHTDWTGKHHTAESKLKIGVANSTHQRGSGNSQYGTRWINNGIINKKIRIDEEMPENWAFGRI